MGIHRLPRLSVSLLLCLVSGGLLLGADASSQPATAPSQADAAKAVIVPLSGQVDDYSRDDLFQRFGQAKAMGAKTIILRIDTYGGLATAGMDISRFLRDQSDVHTIAYVKTKAISAGALIAMACNEIVMSPGAQLGDCAPISFDITGRLEPLPAAERAKAQSPILADFAASARRNGYDPRVAEAMVRVETVIHVVVNSAGEKRFVGDDEYKTLLAAGWTPSPDVPDPVDGADTLLTVGPEVARVLELSKGTVSTADALASDRHLSILADLPPGTKDHIVEFLGNPWVRFLLLTIFIQALNISLHAPGHGAAEAIAIVSLGLLLGVPLLTGYAQWWEILVILGGFALCAFEIFVFPGHGLSLVLGVLMVVFGLVMTFVGKEPSGTPGWLPSMQQTWTSVQNGLLAVIGGLVCSLFLSVWLRRYLPAIPYFNRLILTEVSGGSTPGKLSVPAVREDVWPFLGTVGQAVSELKPGGTARFPFGDDTRAASVVSASGFVPQGARIAVQEVRGTRVVVRKLD